MIAAEVEDVGTDRGNVSGVPIRHDVLGAVVEQSLQGRLVQRGVHVEGAAE